MGPQHQYFYNSQGAADVQPEFTHITYKTLFLSLKLIKDDMNLVQ